MGAARESGSTWPKLLGFFDRNSSSWKTSRPSGPGGSTLSPRTWPASGMTFGGRLYELPKWGTPTLVAGGSDLPGLPTPTARDWKSGASNLHGVNAGQHPDKRKAGGHGPNLADEVTHLLPTPTKSDGTGGPGTSPRREGGMNLRTAVTRVDETWGDFASAIARQTSLSGRNAPEPTEIGPRGGNRLTARFAEWLMGLPDGWVTDVVTDRKEALIVLGNGVVPDQAETAFRHLMTDWPEPKENGS